MQSSGSLGGYATEITTSLASVPATGLHSEEDAMRSASELTSLLLTSLCSGVGREDAHATDSVL